MDKRFQLDGTYIADDIVDLEQTPDTVERFPNGVIPMGQYLGKACYDQDGLLGINDRPNARPIDANVDGLVYFAHVSYAVTETWLEHPYRVRLGEWKG